MNFNAPRQQQRAQFFSTPAGQQNASKTGGVIRSREEAYAANPYTRYIKTNHQMVTNESGNVVCQMCGLSVEELSACNGRPGELMRAIERLQAELDMENARIAARNKQKEKSPSIPQTQKSLESEE